VKEHENFLAEKDSKVKAVEADLAEAHLWIKDQTVHISDQDKQLEEAHANLKEAKICYEHKVKGLKDKVKAEAKLLRDTCSGFAVRCSLRLHEIFSSVGTISGEENYSVDDIPKALGFVENKINEFDEVVEGHGDFSAPVVAWGTTNIFTKARCKHLRDVNKPTFSISPADIKNIPNEARSVGNRFIT
jgi:archaellum component FlaC